MMKIIYFLATIIFLLVTSSANSEPPRASWNHLYSPQNQNQDCFCGNNQIKIKFIAGFIFLNNWRNEWEIGQQASASKNYRFSHIKNTFRWTTIPEDNSNRVFLISWHNMTNNNEFGWTAIKNTKDHWWVASDRVAWTTQASYTRDENMYFTWQTDGVLITIRLRNPKNENGWTSEDIWYTCNCN